METTYTTPSNCSEVELGRYIKLAKNVREKNRLLSVQMRWKGIDVQTISEILHVSDVSVYNWIQRFNSRGLDGLLNRTIGGRPRLIRSGEFKKLLNVFEEPEAVGKIHWTAKKFHSYLKEEVGLECSYSTVVNYLHEHDYKLKYGRSWPEKSSVYTEQREAFILRIKQLQNENDVEIWFMDEAGFDGDPRPRRGWSKKGERKRIYRTQKHLRMSVSGMCCPRTGQMFALEFPYTDRLAFQAFLDVANREIKLDRRRNIIVLDNASWHKSTKIDWGKFEPVFLPPYSPDLNPIERIWLYLKENFFNTFCAKNLEQLIAQLDYALCSLFDTPDQVKSITDNMEI